MKVISTSDRPNSGFHPSQSRIVVAWREFWFAPIPLHSYALLRILLGLVSLTSLLGQSDIATFWSLDGFVPLTDGRGVKGWIISRGLADLSGLLAFAVCVIATTAMTMGLWARVTVPLAFVAALGQNWWNPLPLSGAEALLRGALLYLIWTDCGAVWSVSSWWKRRHGRAPQVALEGAIAPLRLIRFQLALMYLAAGLWKLQSPLWREGTAVHYVLQTNIYHRFPELGPFAAEWFSIAATYLTLFWELGFAFAILYGPTRRWFVLGGIFMHLGMFAFLEIGPFHVMVLACYAAFVPPRLVNEIPTRIRNFARRGWPPVRTTNDRDAMVPAQSSTRLHS